MVFLLGGQLPIRVHFSQQGHFTIDSLHLHILSVLQIPPLYFLTEFHYLLVKLFALQLYFMIVVVNVLEVVVVVPATDCAIILLLQSGPGHHLNKIYVLQYCVRISRWFLRLFLGAMQGNRPDFLPVLQVL